MKLLSFASILLFFILSNASPAFSQSQDSCKAYLIIQQDTFLREGGVHIDSVFLTESYRYTISPLSNNLTDFKTETYCTIKDFEGIRYANEVSFKLFFLSTKDTSIIPDPCTDRTIYFNEDKIIENFKTEKEMHIIPSRSKKRLEDTMISFKAKDMGFNSNQYFWGFELESESESPYIKTTTLQIQEIKLPVSTNWILDGAQDYSIYQKKLEALREIYDLPSREEMRKITEEMYGD